ncbi:hypothetical protein TNCV_2069041 [Trichonephila clavipes]|uniref:Uncharacterized protein n=1 Tax=Trichonephila clavipes TaxID=2585209 RepID=A0A8X6W3G4_TRICX|nr:hypothetical protein TNCV_2069041 [Trichonephila clavipes]
MKRDLIIHKRTAYEISTISNLQRIAFPCNKYSRHENQPPPTPIKTSGRINLILIIFPNSANPLLHARCYLFHVKTISLPENVGNPQRKRHWCLDLMRESNLNSLPWNE